METFIKSVEGNDFIFSEIVEDGETSYDIIADGKEFQMKIVDDRFKFMNTQSMPPWILALEDKLSNIILSRDL